MSLSSNALPEELYNLAISGERAIVEWKRSWKLKDEIKEAMLSFANAIGGKIFVGIEEKTNSEGIINPIWKGLTSPSTKKVKSDVRQWADSLFNPPIIADVESYIYEQKRIDVIDVQISNSKPVCLGRGLYRIRTTDGCRPLLPTDLREIILGKENHKIALLIELKHNLKVLNETKKGFVNDPPVFSEEHFQTYVIQSILSNGFLRDYFDFVKLRRLISYIEIFEKDVERAIIGTLHLRPKDTLKRLENNLPFLEKALANYIKELEQ